MRMITTAPPITPATTAAGPFTATMAAMVTEEALTGTVEAQGVMTAEVEEVVVEEIAAAAVVVMVEVVEGEEVAIRRFVPMTLRRLTVGERGSLGGYWSNGNGIPIPTFSTICCKYRDYLSDCSPLYRRVTDTTVKNVMLFGLYDIAIRATFITR
ncbi:hypothetical protein EDB81DRAFT_944295 [Dactylonectria macrodidyma]|uniref:Uncharacterized protein n=1 Tax=Dactylonectria macrodidyma TaxID=307937 RepID=A0A9P9FF62_9HYPO|nr:hypothetical protein EDB81DRAFT_944295 [Dactylonectria macrodidyma]